MSLLLPKAVCGLAAVLMAAPCLAAEPTQHDSIADPPGWLRLEGEIRARYETLDNQFRAGFEGSDQALAFRTLILAEADLGSVAFGTEIQDSRSYLDDEGSPLSAGLVNPVDLLQAYVRFDDLRVLEHSASLKLGRQTIDVGSRRIIERVEFANVIFSYTGAYLLAESPQGNELHALFVVPVGRFPSDRRSLSENYPKADREEWGRRFWGLHYRRKNAFPALEGTWIEAFVYGLNERDTTRVQTPNRRYISPGFRLFREPGTSRFDFDIEGAYRLGERRQSANAAERTDLKVRASTLHAAVGYTFAGPWRPRLSFDYDYASGEGSPTDNRYEQYDRLFGGRRTDLGHTGIFGPLAPVNLTAPGGRLELTPSSRLDGRINYKAAFLASAVDAWTQARVQDLRGRSGRFIGQLVEARARYWLVPGKLRAEVGGSIFLQGSFARRAPNASQQGDSAYGYFQIAQTF